MAYLQLGCMFFYSLPYSLLIIRSTCYTDCGPLDRVRSQGTKWMYRLLHININSYKMMCMTYLNITILHTAAFSGTEREGVKENRRERD